MFKSSSVLSAPKHHFLFELSFCKKKKVFLNQHACLVHRGVVRQPALTKAFDKSNQVLVVLSIITISTLNFRDGKTLKIILLMSCQSCQTLWALLVCGYTITKMWSSDWCKHTADPFIGAREGKGNFYVAWRKSWWFVMWYDASWLF